VGPCLPSGIWIPYLHITDKENVTHTSREKLDLVNRTKKVIGQLESVLRGLNEDEQCADVLQRLAAAADPSTASWPR
jgi:Metal-sensitive transcriptional repressor